MVCCKAMVSVSIDAFGLVKYNLAHVAIGRASYLADKKKDDLIKYGILWDIAKLFSNNSLIKITRDNAFKELLEIYNLEELVGADMTPILSFDASAPDYSESTFNYMQRAVEMMGYYNTTFSLVYDTLIGYLNELN